MFLLSTLLALQAPAPAEWPQYNGVRSDRASAETLLLREWDAGGPPRVWKVPTSAGFSSFAVAGGRAYTLVSREIAGDGREACVALDVETGEELWATALTTTPAYDRGGNSGADGNEGGDGPRSTPSVDGDRVYALDAELGLTCLDAETGAVVWGRNIQAEYGGRLIRWQNAASPLVEGDLVLLAGGGVDLSLLAFDKRSGELAWALGDELMTHATPVAATIHGVRQVIFYVQAGLVAIAPATGEVLWRTEYPYRTSSAASPVVWEDLVYCSAGYGVGAGVFQIVEDGGELSAELVWRKPNRLINHWSTPVCKDGYLYGMYSFKDYGDGPLACVDLRTGEEQWSTEGFGPGNVILVGSTLVALGDGGQVVLVEATPDEYRELARADVLEGKCWSSPAFSDGQLFVRSTVEGARLDLTGAGVR